MTALVLGFKETGQQIWLGVKPSQVGDESWLGRRQENCTARSVGLRVRSEGQFGFFGIEEVDSLLGEAKVAGIESGNAAMDKAGETNEWVGHTDRGTIESLARSLNLPLPDPFSQDWEYEVADSSRIGDFLKAYSSGHLNPNEQFVLLNIIVASYNDAMSEGTARPEDWALIAHYLIWDRVLHETTIHYWALPDEVELENCFPVTPLIRKVENPMR